MNKPLTLVAVGALGIALFLSMKKRKGAGSAAGSSKRRARKRRAVSRRRRPAVRRRSRRSAKRTLAMLPSGRLARVKINPNFGMAPAIIAKMANPFRKGKARAYHGKKRRGSVYKAKGRFRMIVRTRGGKRISRPWAKKARR